MDNKGYKITDWLFFFNEKNKKDLTKLLFNNKNKELKEEFITWKLITVFLPLVTFLLVVLLNIFTNNYECKNFFNFFNNGSLPIISFGIITSGIPYLLEQLVDFPEFHTVRRRVMAIAIFFLFLSAALYILQTLTIISDKLDFGVKSFILFFSIYVFFFASSIGYKMFLLQSKNIKEYDTLINDEVSSLSKSLDDL